MSKKEMKKYIPFGFFKHVMNATVYKDNDWYTVIGDNSITDGIIDYEVADFTICHGKISIKDYEICKADYISNNIKDSYEHMDDAIASFGLEEPDEEPIPKELRMQEEQNFKTMDEFAYFNGVNKEIKEQKEYQVHIILNKALQEDASARISVLDTVSNDTLILEDIKKARSLDLKVPCKKITIITISDNTVYFRKDYVLDDISTISLDPKDDVNITNVNSQENIMRIDELIIASGYSTQDIQNILEPLRYDLKKIGNHEMISGSIQCWFATRVNGVSASMVCDYAMPDMVKFIDNRMRVVLNERIKDTYPLEAHEIDGIFASGPLYINHNDELIPISKSNIVMSTVPYIPKASKLSRNSIRKQAREI